MQTSIQKQLEDGCSSCGKKPLLSEEAHIATMHLALPEFDTTGKPLPEEKLKWTPGRVVLVCSECADNLRENSDSTE